MEQEYKKKLSDLEDLNESIIIGKPWALRLLETSQKITKKAILNWCSTIMKIGESELNVDHYVDIFLQEISNLYEDLITDVEAIQEKTVDKITKLLDQLQNLCQNLHEETPTFSFEEIPLNQLKMLIEQRVKEYESQVETRRSELRELDHKLSTFCRRLGREPVLLSEAPLFPSPSELDALKRKIQALEAEVKEREQQFFQLKAQITDMVNELQYTPASDFEKEILNLSNLETRITDINMEQLQLFNKRLTKELKNVRDEIGELRTRIEHVWDTFGTDVSEREAFQQLNVGNSLKVLNQLKEEIKKLEDKRRKNIKVFIANQREQLTELWNKCHCSEEERKSFTFFHYDCFTEDLFALHDMEISKWRDYYEDNRKIFDLLHEHQNLQNQLKALDLNSGGADRFKNRGGRLLVEEKTRKKLTFQIPKIEQNLVEMAKTFFVRQGRHFLTFGLTIEDYIAKANEDRSTEVKLTLSAKKQQREQQALTPGSSSKKLFPPAGASSCRSGASCGATKRNVSPLLTGPSKKSRPSFEKKSAKNAYPTVNVSKVRRLSKKMEQQRGKRFSLTRSFKPTASSTTENFNDSSSTISYDDFEIEVSTKYGSRSTGYGNQKSPLITVTSPNGVPHPLESQQWI